MKGKTGKRVISLLLLCVMVFTPVASQAANISFSVDYYYDNNGKRAGINEVIIDDMTYYDVYGGDKNAAGRATTNNPDKFYAAALQNENADGISPLDYWSQLAYAIYAANGTYTAINGISNYASKNSYSKSYYGDVAAMLAGGKSSSDYTNGSDGILATGLQTADSMSSVRDKAFDLVAGDIGRGSVSGSKLKGSITSGTSLDDLDSTESGSKVLYSLVHSMHKYTTNYYDYSVFGLAFYDFKVQILANDKLSYITAAEGYSSVQEAYEHGASGVLYTTDNASSDVLSYYTNGSKEEAAVGMEFEQSNSLEVSNSIETAKSYTYSSMIGSETKISSSIMGLADIEETLKMEFTAEEALSTAYTDSTSNTKETSSTISAEMTLPAQTAVAIDSYSSDTDMILDYDCPIAITYKVKVFSMSGTVWAGPYNYHTGTAGFEHCYFNTTFGVDNDASSGADAVTNLYNRAVVFGENADDSAYGKTYGYDKTEKDGKAAKEISSLKWSDILDGVINESDVVPEYADMYVNCMQVDENGNPIYDYDADGNLIYETDENGDLVLDYNGDPIPQQHVIENYMVDDKGAVGYTSYIRVPYTATGTDGKTYTLYEDEILDADGENINDIEYDSSYGYYLKPFTANPELNTAEMYYYEDTGNKLSYQAPAEEETESSAVEEYSAVEEPVTEEEAAAEEPAAVEEPALAEEDAVEEAAVEEPAAVVEEATVEEPAAVEESASAEEYEAVEEPSAVEPAVEESAIVEEPAESMEYDAVEEPAENEVYSYVEEEVPEETYEAAEVYEPAELAAPVENTASVEEGVPAEAYIPEEYDVIVEEGDLIGSVSNGGTVAGLDSAGSSVSTEPVLTIESIEVVEEGDIPAEIAEAEDTEQTALEVVYTEDPMALSIQPYASAGVNNVVIWLCGHTPMSITGATFNASAKSMYSEIYDIEPIYPLDYIKVTSDQLTFNMISGTTLNVDNIVVDGFNSNNVSYYGFDQDLGTWVITDANGEEISDSGIASLATDPATGETLLTAGNEEGSIYLKYMIDEMASNYIYMNHDEPITNEMLSSTAMVKVNVSKGPFGGNVYATGTLIGYVNDDEPINLDTAEGIDVEVYDEKDRKVYDAAITWEAQKGEQDGIILENNRLSFTKEGEYKIRAVYGYSTVDENSCSDWIIVKALPEKKINTLKIADETSPATLSDITIGEGKETVNLGWLTVSALDQYELDWTKFQNLKWYVDGKEIKANDAGSYLYTATEEDGGTHTIYAMCDGVKSNELTLTVYVPATKVKLSKSSMSLKTGKTKALEATMSPSGTTDTLTWKSSDKKVATVNEKGEVTGVGAGTATITAKATSGKSASCEVTVTMSKGDTFTKGAYTYVVKDASTDGKGKVYMTGFAKGQSKKKVAVPDTVTVSGTTYKVTAIANEAFKDNSKITSFTSGANLTTIGKSAFEGCSKLKTVDIGNSVKKIEFKAFYDCYKLKTLSIGKNVNFMGAHCFCNDYRLQKITIKTTKLKAKNVESPHVFINVNNAKMKVPKSQYKAYTKLFTARDFGGKITK